jgi:HAD superfamily hydrolase (TIGR01549 family)
LFLNSGSDFAKSLEDIRASITWLFFDLDGTLRHNDPDSTASFYDLAEKLGFHTTKEQRWEAERWTHTYWASSSELLHDLETYGDWKGNGDFWANHARRHLMVLGASNEQAEQLASVITETMFADYDPVDSVLDDVIPMLRGLQEGGRRLAVVSNRSEPLGPMLTGLGLVEYFDFTLAAGEVDYWKPDPRLLLHAASMAGAQPDEIIYVGDNYYADVVCSREAGMTPILFDPKGLFPDADCLIISQMRQLQELFEE